MPTSVCNNKIKMEINTDSIISLNFFGWLFLWSCHKACIVYLISMHNVNEDMKTTYEDSVVGLK